MSTISKKSRERTIRAIDHQQYIARITKTLYYGKFGNTDGLSFPVTELAAELFSEPQKGKTLSRLHLNDAAKISRNTCASPCSLILAMLYLERLKACNPEYLERTSPSDLFLVSLMISSKFLFDDGESDEVFMNEWASSAGLTTQELIKLEMDFLQAIEWEVYVNDIKFWKKLNEIETQVAKKQGNQRGYLTYTELTNLLKIIELNQLLQCLVTLSVILAATYTACVLTIAGSFYVTSNLPGTSLYKAPLPETQPKENTNNLTTDSELTNRSTKIDGLKLVKTGLLLASINSIIDPCYKNNTTDLNPENEAPKTSWDWWNNPSMQWLAKTSQIVETINPFQNLDFSYLRYLTSACFERSLEMQLNSHINKVTKTRIQDQLEQDWHEEWTDLLNKKITHSYYIAHLKAS